MHTTKHTHSLTLHLRAKIVWMPYMIYEVFKTLLWKIFIKHYLAYTDTHTTHENETPMQWQTMCKDNECPIKLIEQPYYHKFITHFRCTATFVVVVVIACRLPRHASVNCKQFISIVICCIYTYLDISLNVSYKCTSCKYKKDENKVKGMWW